ncbi:hypothetical protein G7046_g5290 [Stylonectria norvegica]|nr:hypothetical protein G7046_g5290 [Stylonectria norvegica]
MIASWFTYVLALPLLALARPKDAILLSSVQSLTLRGNGAQTSHRRVPASPQLKCVSSKAICDLYDVDVMRCTNQGSSYGDEDIQWSCKATLPEEFKLGSTDVICEGYSSPDDPYVLKGSCGVEYRLALTRKGEQRYPDISHGRGWFDSGDGGTDYGAWLFTFIFVAVLLWIVYAACFRGPDRDPTTRPTRRGGGGGGGGGWNPGWGPDNDPPPPYPGTKPSQQQGWQPGFWSGLAGGAAAGYMAGGRNNRDNRQSGYGGTGGWGGSSNGRSSSSGSSAGGGARHESTGFGSTSRR